MSSSFKIIKTIDEINSKILSGKAIVLNASDMVKYVQDHGTKKAAKDIDVVTTGTFSPMCSSGIFFNFGQEAPYIKASSVTLNDVPAYAGLAAVDAYLGCTEPAIHDTLNNDYPGNFSYGGGHVIEDLVSGKRVSLSASAYGTDCYPRKKISKYITIDDLKNAILLNPRNCYQNYNAAVNLSDKLIYTYMGPLKPKLKNVNYATSGELSPLFNDPYFKTIGLGTKIFLGGGVGYVIGSGTQHNSSPKRNSRGLPLHPAGTLMLKGDLKQMSSEFLRGLSIPGYGCSLNVGVGIPIPILNEEMAYFTSVSNEDIEMPLIDYSVDYPSGSNKILDIVNYSDLFKGKIEYNKHVINSFPLTSYVKSLQIANILKYWIQQNKFLLSFPQDSIDSN